MNRIHRLPDVASARQEASAWIARLHADDVTTDDQTRFAAWYSAHSRHARAYEELSDTVGEVKRAGCIVRAVSFGNAMHVASTPARPEDAGSGVSRHLSGLRLAAAATIAAIALGAVLWITRAAPETLFQTAIGEHASVELPDGSRLELNSNSAARVEYTPRARTIRLTRGEAFFNVAHEPRRPFWVVADQSWIRAVGTAFNVDLRPSGVRVIVSEGTVKVANVPASDSPPSDVSLAKASVSVLTAGQQAEMKAGGARIRSAEPLELTRMAAWRKGKLYFENQQLGAVIEELGRYTTDRITIEDAALRQLPIGGTFQANEQGMEALLAMLQEGFGLTVYREDSHIHIEGAVAE